MSAQLEAQEQDFQRREQEMEARLEEAMDQSRQATQMLQQVRQSKTHIEQDLHDIQIKRAEEVTLKRKLGASEVFRMFV